MQTLTQLLQNPIVTAIGLVLVLFRTTSPDFRVSGDQRQEFGPRAITPLLGRCYPVFEGPFHRRL